MANLPQAGITNRPPEHLLLATFDFASQDVRAALHDLSGVLKAELTSDLNRELSEEEKDKPSEESGELGFDDHYDRAHLTVTLGISASGFEKLGIPEAERPADLRPIPWANLVDEPPAATSGDLVLQICADNLYICEHVVRHIERQLEGELTLLATTIGSQRYNSRPGRTAKREGRALIGFLDGTSNLNPRNSPDDAKLVFVDPAEVGDYPKNPQTEPPPEKTQYGQEPGKGPHFPPDLHDVPTQEPAWTEGGTYMAVRTSTFDTVAWDKLSQNDQEHTVGRFKVSGASLDLRDEDDDLEKEPAFALEQANDAVPVTAHMRKANPREAAEEDAKRRIYRRGYPLIAGADGSLRRGLVFICFARTISTQFEFIVRGWLRNPDFPTQGAGVDPLFEKVGEKVLGGGYYFVPPVEHRTEPWTWRLPG